MVEETLDDFLRKTSHNVQSGVGSVVYSIVEDVMLDLLRKWVTKNIVRLYCDALQHLWSCRGIAEEPVACNCI